MTISPERVYRTLHGPDEPSGERKTETAGRSRTSAATEVRKRQAAVRKARDVALRIDLLDDVTVAQLAELFMSTLVARGFGLPDVGQ